jgi:hypothetical protein
MTISLCYRSLTTLTLEVWLVELMLLLVLPILDARLLSLTIVVKEAAPHCTSVVISHLNLLIVLLKLLLLLHLLHDLLLDISVFKDRCGLHHLVHTLV